jgi:beta-glucosidase
MNSTHLTPGHQLKTIFMQQHYFFMGIILLSIGSLQSSTLVSSSSELNGNLAQHAIDHDPNTRWESEHRDEAQLTLKFAVPTELRNIDLDWDEAKAAALSLQLSNDGKTWANTPVDISEDLSHLSFPKPQSSQWLRFIFKQRATKWGYSLYEIKINGEFLSPPPHLAGRELHKNSAFMNPKLSPKARVADLVQRMTLEEKIAFLGGTGFQYPRKIGETQALYRFGIKPFKMTDATLGSKLTKEATLFPAFIGLAASFNPSLAGDYGKAVAEQCKADGYRILLGPGVNLYRVPNCGRNFEYLGEDPYLTSTLVVPYIKAAQGAGVLATVKHFVANNSDHLRNDSNSVVDERTLREIYFPPFKAAIQEAGVKAVMTSYNLINGHYAGEHQQLLSGILREEWGFQGMIMSDWWSIFHGEKSLQSGLDLEMPAAQILNAKLVQELLKEGKISESWLTEKVSNILLPLCELGLFDEEESDPEMRKKWGEHQAVARAVAKESIVLLKNEANILPLLASKVKSIAVLGKNARETVASGGGAAGFQPGPDFKTYEAALLKEAQRQQIKLHCYESAIPEVSSADVALIFINLVEHEFMDRPFALDPLQQKLITDTLKLNPNTIVIASLGGAIDMQPWLQDVKGLIYAWYPGTYGTEALVDVLFGKTNPSGKLPISIERSESDAPYYGNYLPEGTKLPYTFQGWDHRTPTFDVTYSEGVFTGYRWYTSKGIDPLFPFGFGLSYTSFELSDLKAELHQDSTNNTVKVSLSVKNTGPRDGAEVIQIYVQDMISSEARPVKELKAYQKVTLAAQARSTVSFELDRRALQFWSSKAGQWVIEPGRFRIFAGNSSLDTPLVQTVEVVNVDAHRSLPIK